MPQRKLPDNEILRAMYLSPMSANEIAHALKANVNTVAAALKRVPGLVMRNGSEAQRLAFAKGLHKPSTWWKGRKQPPSMVEKRISKIRGKRHWLWKGGKERRPYRDLVAKEQCAKCSSRLNLGIHHIDFDHYNNEPGNLQVLCLHCHLSLHKTEYWKAKREGRTPLKSTAPHHWRKAHALNHDLRRRTHRTQETGGQ